MTVESVHVPMSPACSVAAGSEMGENGSETSGKVSWPAIGRALPGDFSGWPVLDIEAVAREYIGQLREEARAAEAVSRIKKKLVQMEGDRALAAMRKHADKVRASGIFQGVIAMAAAVATAVSAGVGAAGTAASQAAAQAGSSAAASSGAVAGALAKPVAHAAAKAAFLKAGPQLVQVAAHLDPDRGQAEMQDARRQTHQNRKDIQSLSLQQTEGFLQGLTRMKSRVMQIMERSIQLEEESKKTAATALRG